MWSAIKRLGLAWRLTASNALIFAFVMLCTSLLIISGMYFALFHQAEMAMSKTIDNLYDTVNDPNLELLQDLQRITVKLWIDEKHIEPKVDEIMEGPRGLPLFTMLMVREGTMPPGVSMRVVRNHDRKLVYDTAPTYPNGVILEKQLMEQAPLQEFFKYRVVALNEKTRMFYHRVLVDWGMVSYTVYFMCVIPVDFVLLQQMGLGLLLMNLCGILLSLILCHITTRGALQPLKTISDELQEIEVSQLDSRVTMPEAQDEIYSLAGSVNRMLKRINEGVEREKRFVSDASHELRTPLSIILGHAGLLRRWGKDDQAMLEESLDTIYDEAESMSTLVQRMLELARADQNRLKLAPEVLDAGELVGQLYQELLPVYDKHEMLLGQQESGFVQADKASLRELLLILLENSAKYTPSGGMITMFCKCEKGEIHLGVRDTGMGIPAEALPHIFERFYRVDNARDSKAGGTGLGLALAQQLALANGGRLEAESQPGQGTCMHLYLPLLELE